ncbi:uncharacterized protein [Aegilops tauschii subsp. strangulata]|uniref:uncharacterized protein n=1 Tax=Aegilops tauschii subsp. strangulata TaxID=200361 RepID=UPI00098A05BD|nr:uncharacterized protein LOC109733107 [Aegilops tauschii subsp. strangulata]
MAAESEVDNWLGSGSFATQPALPQQRTPQAAPSLPENRQFSLEYRAARLDDEIWEVRPYFLGRDNMERRFSVSDITFLNLIAPTETEGYGSDDYMYWVKEEGTGHEGLLLLDNQDAVEEMIDHSDFAVLNIIVAKENEDRDVEFNRAHNVCEEQIPIGSPVGDPGFVLSLSQDGVVHPLEVNVNTQQSCNLNIIEAPGGDGGQAGGEESDDDGSDGEEKEADSGGERVVAKGRPEKLKPVRRATVNSGPTSRAHSQPEIPKFQDFVTEPDEYCFPGDVGISDSDGEVPRLPSGRKRRLKKKKERKLYDPNLPDAPKQLCKDLCFTNVYEFRKALRNFHVRTLRNFQYHRNEPTRIIVWCPESKNGCEFFMTASKVAHEDTFTIKKCHLDHSCGACGESIKKTAEWVAEIVEDTVRSNVKADVETILKHTKKKFGVHVPRSLAYRARLMVVDVAQAPTPRFKYMFYCLQASNDGFLAGCRPFIGQQILAATGQDGNNNVFPIAFGVVDKEDGPKWTWFLNQLRVCIGTSNQFGNYTIMSDRQKGLLKAINEVFPQSPQRYCLRHIYANIQSAGFRAEEPKKWVDKANYSFTEHGHKEGMAGLKATCEPAYMWLNGIPKECWARYAMDHVCKTDLVVNNLSEVFDKMILDVRSKPIKTIFEGLRTKLMVKYHGIREKTKSCRWEITPYYMEKLEESKKWDKYREANMDGPNI